MTYSGVFATLAKEMFFTAGEEIYSEEDVRLTLIGVDWEEILLPD